MSSESPSTPPYSGKKRAAGSVCMTSSPLRSRRALGNTAPRQLNPSLAQHRSHSMPLPAPAQPGQLQQTPSPAWGQITEEEAEELSQILSSPPILAPPQSQRHHSAPTPAAALPQVPLPPVALPPAPQNSGRRRQQPQRQPHAHQSHTTTETASASATHHDDTKLPPATQPEIRTVPLSQLLDSLEEPPQHPASPPPKSKEYQTFHRSLVQDIQKARGPRAIIAICYTRLEAILQRPSRYTANEWERAEAPNQLRRIVMHQELEIIHSYRCQARHPPVTVYSSSGGGGGSGKMKENQYHPDIASALQLYEHQAEARLKRFSDDLMILQSHADEGGELKGVKAELVAVRRLAQREIANPVWQGQRRGELGRWVERAGDDDMGRRGGVTRSPVAGASAAGRVVDGPTAAGAVAAGPAASHLVAAGPVASDLVAAGPTASDPVAAGPIDADLVSVHLVAAAAATAASAVASVASATAAAAAVPPAAAFPPSALPTVALPPAALDFGAIGQMIAEQSRAATQNGVVAGATTVIPTATDNNDVNRMVLAHRTAATHNVGEVQVRAAGAARASSQAGGQSAAAGARSNATCTASGLPTASAALSLSDAHLVQAEYDAAGTAAQELIRQSRQVRSRRRLEKKIHDSFRRP